MGSFFLLSKDMFRVALARARNLLFTFLHSPLTWVSKSNLLSILTSSSFSQVLFFYHIHSYSNFYWFFSSNNEMA